MNRLRTNAIMSRLSTGMVAATILVGLLSASAQTGPEDRSRHHRYKVIDLGTLGGPQSIVFGLTGPVNNSGEVTSCADTSSLDLNTPQNPYFAQPNYPDGLDPYIQHTFLWRNGVMKDLGTFRGATSSSCGQWINDDGWVVGGSSNGNIDPLTGYPAVVAALWRDRRIVNLGTLGGNESIAFAINNQGQIAGGALNTVPDDLQFGVLFQVGATQVHAFLWQDGRMKDLGTLGGPDSAAFYVNDRGHAAGNSYTNNIPNPTTGIPTVDPFLWKNNRMIDLGTLGGVFGILNAINNHDQVAGQSDLAGDQAAHPFFWDKGVMTDLGTFGGDNGEALWLNERGDVVGDADFPGDQVHDAFLWRKGTMTDLGNLGRTSIAWGINASGQIAGTSRVDSTTLHGFLWENGGPMVDVNSLISPGSGMVLTNEWFINDRGEIAGWGQLPNGDFHATLLVPCDGHHLGECDDYSMIEVDAPQASAFPAEFSPATLVGNEPVDDRIGPRHNRFGSGPRFAGQPSER